MYREIKTMDIFCYAVLLLVLTAKLCNADEDFEGAQKRAGGNAGLFAFPRVGRSDPELSADWDSYNSFENYDDMPRHEVKRQGLVAFPRVGRSGNQNQRFYQQYSDFIKRSGMQGAGPSTHLWFGPRIGRRSLHDQENEVFTPRLGRSMKYPIYKNSLIHGYDDNTE